MNDTQIHSTFTDVEWMEYRHKSKTIWLSESRCDLEKLRFYVSIKCDNCKIDRVFNGKI